MADANQRRAFEKSTADIWWQLARGGKFVRQWRLEETIKGNMHKLDLETSLKLLPSSKKRAFRVSKVFRF
jgi:hypothetical protein